ncbi:hypothetical protein [Paenibacillus paridis]|uniref:hypothetical protein n=1 Tax=Paenibacillus paridis TaxID=2583376 RepID=UPI00111F9D52|nr:hypothetical protein [Paenibacillus paridis]
MFYPIASDFAFPFGIAIVPDAVLVFVLAVEFAPLIEPALGLETATVLGPEIVVRIVIGLVAVIVIVLEIAIAPIIWFVLKPIYKNVFFRGDLFLQLFVTTIFLTVMLNEHSIS